MSFISKWMTGFRSASLAYPIGGGRQSLMSFIMVPLEIGKLQPTFLLSFYIEQEGWKKKKDKKTFYIVFLIFLIYLGCENWHCSVLFRAFSFVLYFIYFIALVSFLSLFIIIFFNICVGLLPTLPDLAEGSKTGLRIVVMTVNKPGKGS